MKLPLSMFDLSSPLAGEEEWKGLADKAPVVSALLPSERIAAALHWTITSCLHLTRLAFGWDGSSDLFNFSRAFWVRGK